ncbi:MAG: TIGR01777 family oxidoreductase, partial [Saprospiraceae bacterium]|nr:TIGR01777 family oxidoreductase [Saprospiraceae bacterium]
ERNVIDGAVAVINLTGVSIAGNRWTRAYKQQLYDSRILPAGYLNTLIAGAKTPPSVYIGASGVGIYGRSASHPVTEEQVSHDDTFLVKLARDWEAAHAAISTSTRVVIPRIGVVLSNDGGFLERLQLPASLGLYPVFGDGRQILSWIHMDDLTRFFAWLVEQPDLAGPLNAVAPHPVSYRMFARHYRSAKTRYGVIFGIPRWIARLVFGEMSDILFDSTNASAERLLSRGFTFNFPDATGALQALEAGR